ncbi:hypothetical protein KY311_03845, partial [Candidatus Woesearchaeota archaeon]|nr:hypothetical protein [Candidatus Woesearchaeota archaeon]
MIDEKVKHEIIEKIKSAGFSLEGEIGVTAIRESTLKFYVQEKAKEIIGTPNVTKLLNLLGFTTKHAPNIKERLVEELRAVYTKERVEDALNNGTRLPSTTELRKYLKYLHRYNTRLQRSGLPSVRSLIDSLYPEYPHLSYYVTGKVLPEDFDPHQVGERLRREYYQGLDISSTGIRERDLILYKWLITYSKAKSKAKSKKRTKRIIDEPKPKHHNRVRNITDVVKGLTKIKPANFSIRGSKKLKRFGGLSESFTRMLLWSSYIIDAAAAEQTGVFREVFPNPITGVYPVHAKGNEERFLKLKFYPSEQGDTWVYADLMVESKTETGMVEVKNLRTASSQAIK